MSEARPVILIAQADGAAALSPLLIEQGYRVEQNRDAGSLLTDAARLMPALIVLEDRLPAGDAFALCARLRQQGSTPILLLLANDSDDETVERAYRIGATDVLLKPIHPAILIRRIGALIAGQQDTRVDQRRWQQVFERNRAIQLIVNPQTGQIVEANPAACAFYGYPREEFRQKHIDDLDVSTSTDENVTTLFNFRHRMASGQVRDVKIFSNPLEYDGKTLLYLIVFAVGTHSEISESELLATALRNTAVALSSTLDQNELIDRILEQVNVVVPSESANVMLIEAGAARVVRSRGYESQGKEALINEMRLKVSETPSLSWMVENNRALVIPNTATYEGWQPFDATGVWLKSYVSAPIRIGNYVIGFLNIDSSTANHFSAADADHLQIFADQAAIAIRNARLFDRVRRQAAEMERRVIQRTAELEYERGQMRGILDAMTEGVAYTEHDNGAFRVRYVNQALVQMMGFSAEEWIEQALNLFRSKDESDDEFNRLLRESTESLLTVGFWHNEPRLARKDGSEFDAVTITTAVVMPGSNTTGAVTVVRDVSKEKALQQQKARFVAYASHELRTPITNLITRLYLMRRQPDRLEEHMHVLEHVTNRMKHLVEDLLDISRFERGVIMLDFQDVILQDVIKMLVSVQQPEAERKGLLLTSSLTETPLHVRADAERLGQVITNLLTNAINYTLGGGRIEVRLTQVCNEVGETACVEIEDTGIGIADEHLPHIFQPFYRVVSQIEGTGLGLSITQEIVELHGGAITVSSQIGVGSTFCFWLPLIDAPDTQADA